MVVLDAPLLRREAIHIDQARANHGADDCKLGPGDVVLFKHARPELGPMPSLDLNGIDWVIVGGEPGPGARAMAPERARDIRDQCAAVHVPFFIQQWGGTNKKKAGRMLDGRTWDGLPKVR